DSTPAEKPVRKPAMLGCEPAFSPFAEPTRAHIISHCLTRCESCIRRLARTVERSIRRPNWHWWPREEILRGLWRRIFRLRLPLGNFLCDLLGGALLLPFFRLSVGGCGGHCPGRPIGHRCIDCHRRHWHRLTRGRIGSARPAKIVCSPGRSGDRFTFCEDLRCGRVAVDLAAAWPPKQVVAILAVLRIFIFRRAGQGNNWP